MKECRECGEVKPLSEFYKHSGMADGHLNQCKACKRAYQRARHHEKMQDPEWRERERERNRDKWRRLSDDWSSGVTREQRQARWAAHNAIRDGRLDPDDECEECGHDFSEFRREAHHEDYDYPLEVAWLCALCHGKRHRTEVTV